MDVSYLGTLHKDTGCCSCDAVDWSRVDGTSLFCLSTGDGKGMKKEGLEDGLDEEKGARWRLETTRDQDPEYKIRVSSRKDI